MTIPVGFLLVVGLSVFLLAVLAILQLAWLIDIAKTIRRTSRPEREDH